MLKEFSLHKQVKISVLHSVFALPCFNLGAINLLGGKAEASEMQNFLFCIHWFAVGFSRENSSFSGAIYRALLI